MKMFMPMPPVLGIRPRLGPILLPALGDEDRSSTKAAESTGRMNQPFCNPRTGRRRVA